MHYEQFNVKYKGLNRGYINYRVMSFSDLELSLLFELRFCLKLFFVRCSLKGPLLSLLNFIGMSCDQVSMETKRVILARFVDFDVTATNVLPWQPDVRFSEKFSFC